MGSIENFSKALIAELKAKKAVSMEDNIVILCLLISETELFVFREWTKLSASLQCSSNVPSDIPI